MNKTLYFLKDNGLYFAFWVAPGELRAFAGGLPFSSLADLFQSADNAGFKEIAYLEPKAL